MATKLTDAAYTERHRAANRARSERQRERRVGAGRASLTVWIQRGTKARFLALVAREQSTTGAMADRLLTAALVARAKPCPQGECVDNPPVESAVVDRDAAILELHSTGISLSRISAELATRGVLTATGKPLSVSTINRVLSIHNLVANGEKKGKNLN